MASFIDHYLPLLDFPDDVTGALASGDINLFEAEQLARITPKRLKSAAGKAKSVRAELLSSHLQTKESGERLRRRVNELLRGGESPNEVQAIEDLEDFDPYDPTHLFWEQIKQLGFAFREIRREDVLDEEVEELLKTSEPILAILNRIQRRKEQQRVVKVKF